MITATPTRSYGDCQMALQGNLNHDKTPRGAGRVVHLSLWTQRIRPAATNRPRRRRLHKKKTTRGASGDDETEYYKVS